MDEEHGLKRLKPLAYFFGGLVLMVALAWAWIAFRSHQARKVLPEISHLQMTTPSTDPGAVVSFSFDLKHLPLNDLNHWDARLEFKVMDADGQLVIPPKESSVTGAPSSEDEPKKIQFDFSLPIYAVGGKYSFLVRLEDLVYHRIVSTTTFFPVSATEGPFPETLQVFSNEFLGRPVISGQSTVYHPGEDMRVKALVGGFQTGEGNRTDLKVDLAIVSESGEVHLLHENAVRIQQSLFYRPQYMPLIASLKIPEDFRPGIYHVVYIVQDGLAGKKVQSEFPFQVVVP